MAFMAHPLPDSGWCDPSAKRSRPVMRARSIAIASLLDITANSLSPACPVRCGAGVRGPSHADYGSDGCQLWMLVSTGRSRIGQSSRLLTSSWRAPHDVGAEPVYRSTELIVRHTCHPRQWHPGHAYRPNVLHHHRGGAQALVRPRPDVGR